MNPEIGQRDQLVAEREQLGRTVQALADRFDVSARAKQAADDARASGARAWNQAVRSGYFVPTAAAVGAMLALIGAAAWRRRREPGPPDQP